MGVPKKLPQRTSFRVILPEDLIPEIDKIVQEDLYDGRGDFALRLIRDYIDERRRMEQTRMEYEMYLEKKKKK